MAKLTMINNVRPARFSFMRQVINPITRGVRNIGNMALRAPQELGSAVGAMTGMPMWMVDNSGFDEEKGISTKSACLAIQEQSMVTAMGQVVLNVQDLVEFSQMSSLTDSLSPIRGLIINHIKRTVENLVYWENELPHILKSRQALLDAGAKSQIDILSKKENIEIEQRYNQLNVKAFLNHLGINLGKAGQYELAIEVFQKALQIESDPDDPATACLYHSLGTAYRLSSQHDLAIEAYQKAIQIKPDYDAAQKVLEMALAKQKEEGNLKVT